MMGDMPAVTERQICLARYIRYAAAWQAAPDPQRLLDMLIAVREYRSASRRRTAASRR